MEFLRFGFAFGGVLLALVSSLTSLDLSSYALTMFALLAIISWRKLNRLALSFLFICAIAAIFVLWINNATVDPKPSSFIFAFLLVSGSLRTAAMNEQSLQELGQKLAHGPQRNRFAVISLGTGMLALVLLNGALQFVTGIFSEKSNSPLSQRLPIMRAIIAGFSLNPILSPIAIPFVVISSMLPTMSWTPLAPYLLTCAVVVWLSGALQARAINEGAGAARTDETPPQETTSFRSLLIAVLLIFTPIATTVFLVVALNFKPAHAAFTSIFLGSLIWPVFRLKQPHLVFSGYSVAINEATVVGGSIFLGMLLVNYFPTGYSETASQVLLASGVAAPAIIFAYFVAGGLIGIQPSICFLLTYATVLLYTNTVGAYIAPTMAALIVGWALNSVVSPFGIPVMIVSGAFRMKSHEFAFRYGVLFLFFCVLGCAAVLTFGSILL
jgi:hypothetical protein